MNKKYKRKFLNHLQDKIYQYNSYNVILETANYLSIQIRYKNLMYKVKAQKSIGPYQPVWRA